MLAMPDNGMVYAQNHCERLIRYDAASTLLWNKALTLEGQQPSGCKQAWLDDVDGAPAIAVVNTRLIDRIYQPFIVLVDSDTESIRSRRGYDGVVNSAVAGISVTPHGTLLLAGATDVDPRALGSAEAYFSGAQGAGIDVPPGGGAVVTGTSGLGDHAAAWVPALTRSGTVTNTSPPRFHGVLGRELREQDPMHRWVPADAQAPAHDALARACAAAVGGGVNDHGGAAERRVRAPRRDLPCYPRTQLNRWAPLLH